MKTCSLFSLSNFKLPYFFPPLNTFLLWIVSAVKTSSWWIVFLLWILSSLDLLVPVYIWKKLYLDFQIISFIQISKILSKGIVHHISVNLLTTNYLGTYVVKESKESLITYISLRQQFKLYLRFQKIKYQYFPSFEFLVHLNFQKWIAFAEIIWVHAAFRIS